MSINSMHNNKYGPLNFFKFILFLFVFSLLSVLTTSQIYASTREVTQEQNTVRTIQAIVGSDSYQYLRYSDNGGTSWSDWIKSGSIKTSGSISILRSIGLDSRLINVMKGSDGGIYTRYANNVGFTQANDSQWSSWQDNGNQGNVRWGLTTHTCCGSDIGGGVVVQYVAKGSGNFPSPISQITSSNGGQTWAQGSNETGVSTLANNLTGDPAFVTIYGGMSPALSFLDTSSKVEVARMIDKKVYSHVATSTNAWTKVSDDLTLGNPQLFNTGRRGLVAILATKLTDNFLVIRTSSDEGSTWNNRNREWGSAAYLKSGVSMAKIYSGDLMIEGNVVMSYIATDNKIYTKVSSNNGTTWTRALIGSTLPGGVIPAGTPKNVTSSAPGNSVMSLVRGNDGYVYTRRSSDGGATWTKWKDKGSIRTASSISATADVDSYHSNRILVTLTGLDGKIYTRYTDDFGSNWSTWIKSGKSGKASTFVFYSQPSE